MWRSSWDASTSPVGNTALDIKDAAQGQPDRYGKTRNLPQALARAAGIKIEQYGPEQIQLQKERDLKYEAVAMNQTAKSVKEINKELAAGTIDEKTAQARIKQNLLSRAHSSVQKWHLIPLPRHQHQHQQYRHLLMQH